MLRLLLVLCALAAAQPMDQSPVPGVPSADEAPARRDQPADPGSQASPQPDSSSQTAEPGDSKPMTIDDARLNFGTVVETFIAARSPKGHWPLTQKSSGKTLRLKYQEVEKKTVREVGPSHFAGRVVLLDTESGRPVKAEFFVDFTGYSWSVEKLRILPGPSTGGAKTRRPVKKAVAEPAPAPEGSAQP